jgi:hypothetical protein
MIPRVDGASHKSRKPGGSGPRLGNSAQWPMSGVMGTEEGIPANACTNPIISNKDETGDAGKKVIPEK